MDRRQIHGWRYTSHGSLHSFRHRKLSMTGVTVPMDLSFCPMGYYEDVVDRNFHCLSKLYLLNTQCLGP